MTFSTVLASTRAHRFPRTYVFKIQAEKKIAYSKLDVKERHDLTLSYTELIITKRLK